jgi:hypothetical protein
MHRYRNKKTGAVIYTYGKVSGKNWEPVDEAPNSDAAPVVKQPAKRKTSRKEK